MPAEIILQQSPDAAALIEMRLRLAAVRSALAEREAEVARTRSQLKAFEGRYLHRVGILYAELDEIVARITEREVDIYDSDFARRRAQEARQRAQETHDAAFGADQEPEEFDPSPDEGNAAALLRITRQIQHAERDIAALDREHETLVGSEIGQLYVDAEAASREDRDLLAELAAGLRERISDAQYRLEFVDRQVNALGR
jgi:hypothetical protein